MFIKIIIFCVFAGDIVELFMRYFLNFGDKPCCVSDLKTFLPLLSNDRAKDVIQKVNETVGLRAGELPSSVCLQEKEECVIWYTVIYILWDRTFCRSIPLFTYLPCNILFISCPSVYTV
jgi:hypothetical protein